MTAGSAIDRADQLRPNNEFADEVKRGWLRECDARLRSDVVEKYAKGALTDVGADLYEEENLAYDTMLLVPDSYSALYPHWLCAQIDLALGETARAANELQLYNDAVQSFGAWLRRTWPERGGAGVTAGRVIRMAEQMRPDYDFSPMLKQNWLRECDARLRRNVVEKNLCGEFDAVGADVNWMDGLDEETCLLAGETHSSIYTHWLCAQMDFAKGDANRAVNEMELYNEAVQEFAIWMRRRHTPAGGAQWRY